MMRHVRFVILWICNFGIWMLLIADISVRDVFVGIVSVSLTTLMVTRAARKMNVKFGPTISDLLQVWRVPVYVVTGTGEVLWALGRQLFSAAGAPSELVAVPFDYGDGDARSAGRHALATTYTTMTPNSIVLGYVRRDEGPYPSDVMLVHRIKPGKINEITRQLGAKSL